MKKHDSLEINHLIFFIVGWICFSSIILPFIIILFFENIAINVPVDRCELFFTFVREGMMLLASYFIYRVNVKFIIKDYSNYQYIIMPDLISRLLAIICAIIILVYGVGNTIMPPSYVSVNSIDSNEVFGGDVAIATFYPLFVSIVIGSTTYLLLDQSSHKYALIWFFNLSLVFTALSGTASGGRMAMLYPLLPYFFSYILKNGFFNFLKNYFFLIFLSIPFIAIFIIYIAKKRIDDSVEIFIANIDYFELFFTHLYIKFSGATNSTFLFLNSSPEEYGSTLTALSGSILTFIPRFFFEKPISGSLNGYESGLPYRIAAKILGYEDYGNVVLSPATLSYWLAGVGGIVANILTFACSLILTHILIRKGLIMKSPVFIGVAFYLIGMPHLISFYVDFTQGVSVIIRGVVMYSILLFIKKITKNYLSE